LKVPKTFIKNCRAGLEYRLVTSLHLLIHHFDMLVYYCKITALIYRYTVIASLIRLLI